MVIIKKIKGSIQLQLEGEDMTWPVGKTMVCSLKQSAVPIVTTIRTVNL
jgi:hypothetical protein